MGFGVGGGTSSSFSALGRGVARPARGELSTSPARLLARLRVRIREGSGERTDVRGRVGVRVRARVRVRVRVGAKVRVRVTAKATLLRVGGSG